MKGYFAGKKRGLLLIVLFYWMAGCTGTSEPVKFYRLTPVVPADSSDNSGTGGTAIRIGLGPIEFPDYLNRPQLVLDAGGSGIIISEFHRWAEPLRKNFSSTLVENLEVLLLPNTIFEYPWPPSIQVDWRIILQVIRFEGDNGGKVELIARWMMLEGGKQNLDRTGRARILETVSSAGDFDALVAAQSRAVGELSREIAREVLSLSSMNSP